MGKSLRTISLALNGEDSETAHYAASVLRDELNNFRSTVQKLYVEIKKDFFGLRTSALIMHYAL